MRTKLRPTHEPQSEPPPKTKASSSWFGGDSDEEVVEDDGTGNPHPLHGARGRAAIEKQLSRFQLAAGERQKTADLTHQHENTHLASTFLSNTIADDLAASTYSSASGRCRSRSASPSRAGQPGVKETWRLPPHKSHIVPPCADRIPVSPYLAQSLHDQHRPDLSATTASAASALVAPTRALSPESVRAAVSTTMTTVSTGHLQCGPWVGERASRARYSPEQRRHKLAQWQQKLPTFKQAPPHRDARDSALPVIIPPHATTAEKEQVHAEEVERSRRRLEYAAAVKAERERKVRVADDARANASKDKSACAIM